ncbi:MAG: lysostaphin resistance A-like protein [Bacteroidales bacterium]
MKKSSTSIQPWVRTIIIFPAFLFIVGFFQFIGFAVQGLNIAKDHVHETPIQETIGALFTLMGTLLVVRLFSHFIDKIKFRELGFNPKGAVQQMAAGFLVGIFVLGFGFLFLLLFQQIHWQSTHFVLRDLVTEVFLFLLVAFSEELLSRGYILNNLMQSMNRSWALVVSALMFSFIHILNPNFSWLGFANIFLAGVLLGLPYSYTRQLWFPMAFHFSWNFFQGPIFGFNVSGVEMYTLITQTRSADTIWNGGKFGFEGSLFCTVIQIIAIGGLWGYYHQKEALSEKTDVAEIVTETEVL